jgi:hypothetical protein
VDPRTGLDAVERRKFLTLPRLELRPLSRPVAKPTELSRLLAVSGRNYRKIELLTNIHNDRIASVCKHPVQCWGFTEFVPNLASPYISFTEPMQKVKLSLRLTN